MRHGETGCPIDTTLRLIGGKWKPRMVYQLRGGALRYSDLRARLPGISSQMMTVVLREMERDGLVSREAFAEAPPRTEYRLTPMGESLRPVMDAMCAWGEAHAPRPPLGWGNVAAMLTAEQVERYRKDGFLLGPQVLSEDEVAELQAETLRVIEDRDDASKPQPVLCHNMTGDPERAVWQIVDIFRASPAFRRLVAHPTIAEELAQLAGADEIRLWHDQIQYKPAGVGGPNHWHQDAPYWPPLTPKDEQLTAWVALDDVDEENGCMRMVPGSHEWGTHIRWLEALPSFDAMPSSFGGSPIDVRSCPVRKGQVHYHHGLTWHGSGANGSGRPRRAIAIHTMTGRTRFASGEKAHVLTPMIEAEPGVPLMGELFPRIWPREG